MVRDVVTHLLIGEDVAQDATSLANLDAGEILFIDKGGNPLDKSALTELAPNEPFYIAEGKKGTATKHIVSPRLTKASITAYRGSSYAAEVQQVSYIGDNGNTTGDINVLNNTEYALTISFGYDKDIYSQRRNIRRFNYTSSAAETVTGIVNAFVTMMNKDKDFARQAVAEVETGGGGKGIKITGKNLPDSNTEKPLLVSFEITLELGFDATVLLDEFGYDQSVAPKPGVGDFDSIKALERNGLGFTVGQTNLRKFPIVGPDSRVSPTGTYDMYVIDYFNEHKSGEIGLGATRKAYGQIIIANNIATTVNSTTGELESRIEAASGITVNL